MNGQVYTVRTLAERRPVTGSDSMISTMPEALYVPIAGGPPALNVSALGRLLRQISEYGAANCGQVLHHADWVITDDPAVVEERGMHGSDCARCRASTDQALAFLADHKRALLVGILYWAAP